MKANPGWSTPTELRQQVIRQWDGLLAALALGEEFAPLRLRLKCPSSSELSEHFAEVRDWIVTLQDAEKHGYRIVWKDINHRTLGQNRLPSEVWIDTLETAGFLAGTRSDITIYRQMVEVTRQQQPELLAWLARYPRKAIGASSVWSLLLSIVAWRREHPRPDVYLRQVDLPGVHSKLIEEFRGILSELLDLVLPSEEVDRSVTGVGNFCQRYGFRNKPMLVRFRSLDPDVPILVAGGAPDLTVTREDMARLNLPVKRIFIIENEVTYLAFPQVRDSIAIFGAGYCFDNLKPAEWLRRTNVFYWGDLDTHGFSILDQLRSVLPDASSFFMDQKTLLAHRIFWVKESSPSTATLHRLSSDEAALYENLRNNTFAESVRLEQERIPLSWVQMYLNDNFHNFQMPNP